MAVGQDSQANMHCELAFDCLTASVEVPSIEGIATAESSMRTAICVVGCSINPLPTPGRSWITGMLRAVKSLAGQCRTVRGSVGWRAVCTPIALLNSSKRSLATWESVRMVRFGVGFDRYAVAAVTRRPS